MEDITGYSMKDCLSLPGLIWKNFNSIGTEEDEPIYTYDDKYRRWFVRQSIKGGRVCAFNQNYKSSVYDDIINIISKELCVEGKIFDILEEYLRYKKKHYERFEKENKNQFNDYRHEIEEEQQQHINEKLSNLRLHIFLQRIEITRFLWDFDAVSLYPSAMWD